MGVWHSALSAEHRDRLQRARIREAARAVVARCGADGASVSAIAAEAGLSRPWFYRYYADKEQAIQDAESPVAIVREGDLAAILDDLDALTDFVVDAIVSGDGAALTTFLAAAAGGTPTVGDLVDIARAGLRGGAKAALAAAGTRGIEGSLPHQMRRCLRDIGAHPGARPVEIARRIEVASSSHMTRMLAGLAYRGLIRRVGDGWETTESGMALLHSQTQDRVQSRRVGSSVAR